MIFEMLLNKIPHKKVETDIEAIDLYQLGTFKESAYTLVELQQGKNYPPHVHHHSKARLHVVLGKGIIIIGKKENKYCAGDYFLIPKGESHGFKIKEQTLLLSIETPPIIDAETQEVDIEYVDSKKKGGRVTNK